MRRLAGRRSYLLSYDGIRVRAAAIAATKGGRQGVFAQVPLLVSGKGGWSGRGVLGGYLREAGTGLGV